MTIREGWLILFDAVGTLIYPDPHAISVYQDAAARFGIRLPRETVAERFRSGRQKFFARADSGLPTANLPSSDSIERESWFQLVRFVLREVDPIETVFESLWEHFAKPVNWNVFPDVEPCWSQLRETGVHIGIASDFDSRLPPIVEAIHPLSQSEFLFYSAQIGFRKSDVSFYQSISKRLAGFSFDRIIMIGDDFERDVVVPKQLGWEAIWLHRTEATATSHFETPTVMRSLDELAGWLSEGKSA